MAACGEHAFPAYSDFGAQCGNLEQMQQFFLDRTAALTQANYELQRENMMLRNAQLQQENVRLRSAVQALMKQEKVPAPPGLEASPKPMLAGMCKKSPRMNRGRSSTVSTVAPSEPLLREDSEPSSDDTVLAPVETMIAAGTSTMMRNLPNDYTRSMLVDLLRLEGFEGSFDFLYLPIDFRSQSGLGYAFINFTTTELAQQFIEHFTGFNRWTVGSNKVCEVVWSSLQGLKAHIDRYRNSPVMHESVPEDQRPVLFQGSEQLAFPPPTKKIRGPQRWHRRP